MYSTTRFNNNDRYRILATNKRAFGLATVLCLVFALSSVPASNAQDDQPPSGSRDADQAAADGLERRFDLTSEEAAERIATEPAVTKLYERVTATDRESFGGFWRDNATGTVNIAYVDGRIPSRIESASAESAVSANVEFTSVDNSLDELLAVLTDLIDRRERVRAGASGEDHPAWLRRADLDLDEPGNRVQVLVAEADQTAAASSDTREWFGADVVEVGRYTGPPAQGEVCTTRQNCDTEARGGLEITNSAGVPCTTGFTVVRGGSRGSLTAGHCDGVSLAFRTSRTCFAPSPDPSRGGVDGHRDVEQIENLAL